MRILTEICEVYLVNLKNYSMAISYGEKALKIAKTGIAEGPEKEPDNHFQPLLGLNPHKHMGARKIAREKVYWYHVQKGRLVDFIAQAYRAVGDIKKAAMIEKEERESGSEALLARLFEETLQEALERQKLQDTKYRDEQWNAERYEAFLKETKQDMQRHEDLDAVMDKQAALGDLSSLRESLLERLRMRVGVRVSKKSLMTDDPALANKFVFAYLGISAEAFNFGLYREAYAYSLEALKHRSAAVKGYERMYAKHLNPPYWWDQLYAPFAIDLHLRAGMSLNRLGRYSESIPFLKKVYEQETFRQHDLPDLEIWDSKHLAAYELAQAFEMTDQRAKAIETYKACLDYLEGIRASLTKESHRVGFMAAQREIYDKIIRYLIGQGLMAEALEYAERSRARAFLDLLAGKDLRPKNEATISLLAKKRSLDNELERLAKGPPQSVSDERSLQIVLQKRDDLMRKMERYDPELVSLMSAKPLSAGEIQALLEKDTALVEYYVTREGFVIWVVTANEVHAKWISAPISLLVKKVADFRESLRKEGKTKKTAPSKDLEEKAASLVRLEITPARFKKGAPHVYQVFVQNSLPIFLTIDEAVIRIGDWAKRTKSLLEREIPGQKRKMIYEESATWGITPGDHQVILRTDQGELASNIIRVREVRKGDYTVTDLGHPREERSEESSTLRDASLFDLLIKPVKPHLGNLRLAIVPHGILHYISFAALNSDGRFLLEDYAIFRLPSASVFKFCRQKNKHIGEKLLALGNPQLKLPYSALPFSANEVAAIGKLFSKSKILIGSEANETTFKAEARSHKVLHLACHGIFDAEQPLNSALLLSSSSRDDGMLTASEIFDLPLDASLVTLSACQSGMSRIRAGDESMGLPRAFIYAGSPSIIASLWNVSDKATAQFMKNLYEFLKGKDKVSALRATQLRFLKDPDYRHPYFWSGFTLIGNYL